MAELRNTFPKVTFGKQSNAVPRQRRRNSNLRLYAPLARNIIQNLENIKQ